MVDSKTCPNHEQSWALRKFVEMISSLRFETSDAFGRKLPGRAHTKKRVSTINWDPAWILQSPLVASIRTRLRSSELRTGRLSTANHSIQCKTSLFAGTSEYPLRRKVRGADNQQERPGEQSTGILRDYMRHSSE